MTIHTSASQSEGHSRFNQFWRSGFQSGFQGLKIAWNFLDAKMAKDEVAACLTQAREKAERAFQRIIAGVGVPSAFQGCPIKPLLERTLDVTQVEPLPAAEYLLILDRIKRHSLFHDLAAAKKAKSAPGSVTTCYDKPFDLDRYKETLSAIAEAFPPARKVPQIKL